MLKVSVIIPVHNAAAYIPRALGSVLMQDYPDLEIVIVNDGSTDETEKVLQRYLHDNRIIYIKTENGGVSRALNTGLGRASGDYISFLHADDMFFPGKIKKQALCMEQQKTEGVSYTDENYFREDESKLVRSQYFHFSGDIFYFLKRNNFIHMSTTMFRRDVLKTARFDETLRCHEDWDLFLRLAAQGVRFLYIGETLSSIRVHPKSLSSDTAVMDQTRAEVGARARQLWKTFKKNIDLRSASGLYNLRRYLRFKLSALLSGFPHGRRFNAPAPQELL